MQRQAVSDSRHGKLTDTKVKVPSSVISFEKSPASFIYVFVEGARSAAPPIRPGTLSFNRLIITPDKALVAWGLSSQAQ